MSSRSIDSQPPEAAWSEVERELLGAAREERMPAELEARLRDALAFAPSSAELAPRTSFNDTARARQLFASKVSLWGMLGIVALGAISYYALTRGASQPMAVVTRQPVTAPAQSSTPHEAAQLAASASARQAMAHGAAATQGEATAQEPASTQHAGIGSASASARREAVSAQREGAGRELAHARDGKRAEATTVRPRAATSVEPQVAPPMAAEHGATRLDVGPAHEANVVSANATQSSKAATPDQLRLEARLLESARSALGQGALPEARQWLARYRAQFARGALQPESQVLGIELAVRTGERSTAKAQAEHFLAQHPHHPLRDRVQLLTREPR